MAKKKLSHTAPLIANLADEHPMTEEWTPGPKHKLRERKPGEVIFRMVKGTETRRLEFRRHEEARVEVQLGRAARRRDRGQRRGGDPTPGR